MEFPKVEGWKAGSVIQFKESDQHFRTVKIFGKNVTVLDGDSVTQIKDCNYEDRDKVLNEYNLRFVYEY